MRFLTFDIEEWYLTRRYDDVPMEIWPMMESRVIEDTMQILKFLDQYQLKAHFFIMGWIAEQYPQLIPRLVQKGHTIGYHSYYHQKVEDISVTEFEYDLKKGIQILENQSQQKITSYRAPQFSFSDKTLDRYPILKRHGIEVSSSVKAGTRLLDFEIQNEAYLVEFQEDKIIELPLNRFETALTSLSYSGSGYFRLLPSSFINNLIMKDNYTMMYFHPRDFSIKVPYTSHNSIWRYFLNNLGNKSTSKKLGKLVKELDFRPFEETIKSLDVNRLKRIKLEC